MTDDQSNFNISNTTNSSIAAVRSYSFMKPGSNKVVVSVKNLTSKEIILKAETVVEKVEAANAVPPMLAPKSENVNATSNIFQTLHLALQLLQKQKRKTEKYQRSAY